MSKNYYINLLILIAFVSQNFGCKAKDTTDNIPPALVSSIPANGATEVDITTSISVKFSEDILLSSAPQIKLNGQLVSVSVNGNTLNVSATLQPGTAYSLTIPGASVFDVANNHISDLTITFTTAGKALSNVYEAENASLNGGAAVATSLTGYTGTGYVNTNAGNVTFSVQTDQTAYYDVSLRYAVSDQKANNLYVDNVLATSMTFPISTSWTTIKVGKIKLSAGSHTISVVKDWGYIQLDNMTLTYYGPTLDPFNIASSLVTPNPSAQAVKLYNYLKTNFGTKIISGTMANYSTNIDEAIWVNTNTGKWPAMTTFDFIDHTNINQSWIKYSAPFVLGQDWWNNNGIVGLMWHWRDPLTKTGDFYTSKTTFDVSKITDTNSAEYKAMIADIDLISGYLKQFKDAGIPVIWRPLHEASGGWFWWGAKGAAPCKALWKVMFDRMVNYHGLNNMIWVWTSDATTDAVNWYPGDAYVDIIGMDIYPGENQHGSQYISFNKVKDMFGGKKILTLSECGSVPDPALMLEYGYTWSWFMPWNSDYTRLSTYNGATWWNKFFSYDFVISRDKMPSLK
ncbi:MAG: glycosyl hydrolase [Paludibacteraceae bacterium]